MADVPRTMAEYIEAIRAGLVCERCGRYVGSLAAKAYLPPLFPIAFEDIPADDEARSLIQFEWHLLGMMRQGKFVIRHPEKDGKCVSVREWAESDDDEDAEVGDEAV
ncbi:MAG: hypothetical protein HY873_10335 [Chloroflexi bacterium]|nr:hypothetical protein [Chloroflexota bacterium]